MASWKAEFLDNFDNIFDLLSTNFYDSENLTLYGSAAIAILVFNYNEKNNDKIDIKLLTEPNDFDFLYQPKNRMEYHTDKYKNYVRKQETPQRSVTYVHNNNNKLNFDLTAEKRIKFIKINNFKVLDPLELKEIYSDMYQSEIVVKKINILNILINKNKKKNLITNLNNTKKRNHNDLFLDLNENNENNENNTKKRNHNNLFFDSNENNIKKIKRDIFS